MPALATAIVICWFGCLCTGSIGSSVKRDLQVIAAKVLLFKKKSSRFTPEPFIISFLLSAFRLLLFALCYKLSSLFKFPKILAVFNGQQTFVNQTDYIVNIFFVYHLYRGVHVTQRQ
jgi:hypothetical protein